MTYTLSKSMENTFDFGYDVTVYTDDNIVKAYVYDKDDFDEFVMSYIVCESHNSLFPSVIFITGVVCHRYLCYGTKIIDSFEEGNMGKHILREMKDIFKPIYNDAQILLYSDIDFDTYCNMIKAIYVENAPLWINYKHNNENILDTLHLFHSKFFPKIEDN